MTDKEFSEYLLDENEKLEQEIKSLKAGQSAQPPSPEDKLKMEVDEAVRKNRADEAKAKEERLKKVREAQSKQPTVIHPIYRSF
jgi:hypothetical protein